MPAKPPRTLGILLALLGCFLGIGGMWLMSRGASAYFAVVGSGLAISGVLLSGAKKTGLVAYLMVLIVIIGWSAVETSGNVGALLPRIALPLIIGFYLLQEKVRVTLT